MFRIGQKVVCVEDRAEAAGDILDGWIKAGNIYVIRSMEFCPVQNRLGVRVEGVILPTNPFFNDEENLIEAFRFRPIVEKKTDISVFEEILRRETIDDVERVS